MPITGIIYVYSKACAVGAERAAPWFVGVMITNYLALKPSPTCCFFSYIIATLFGYFQQNFGHFLDVEVRLVISIKLTINFERVTLF